MTEFRCPGQDMRYWKPEDIFSMRCVNCGEEIEFFKDEPFRLCPACKKEVRNPRMNLGCAKWCKFAKECLGVSPGKDASESLCERLLATMKALPGVAPLQLELSVKALRLAEGMLEGGEADPLIVRAACVLHCLEPQAAEDILDGLGIERDSAAGVIGIIKALRSGGELDSREFRIVSKSVQTAHQP
jgi:hypothetical protein